MLLWLLARSTLELGDGGVGLGQPLPDRPRRLVRRQRLCRLAGLAQQVADVVVARRQVALELGDGGVGVGQPLAGSPAPCRTTPAPLPACRSRTADADVVVARRQVALEVGDGGVGLGQPLLDRPRLPGTTPAPLPACRSRSAECRCCCGFVARSRLELGDGGVGPRQRRSPAIASELPRYDDRAPRTCRQVAFLARLPSGDPAARGRPPAFVRRPSARPARPTGLAAAASAWPVARRSPAVLSRRSCPPASPSRMHWPSAAATAGRPGPRACPPAAGRTRPRPRSSRSRTA